MKFVLSSAFMASILMIQPQGVAAVMYSEQQQCNIIQDEPIQVGIPGLADPNTGTFLPCLTANDNEVLDWVRSCSYAQMQKRQGIHRRNRNRNLRGDSFQHDVIDKHNEEEQQEHRKLNLPTCCYNASDCCNQPLVCYGVPGSPCVRLRALGEQQEVEEERDEDRELSYYHYDIFITGGYNTYSCMEESGISAYDYLVNGDGTICGCSEQPPPGAATCLGSIPVEIKWKV